ncbi:MAG: 4-hydroxythreonine-4-phosphate dehydrogenase PdxA, partial [bacterium]
MQPVSDKPVVAITVGDFNGIGPEVTLKSLTEPEVWDACQPLLVGPRQVFEYYATQYRLPFALPSDHPDQNLFHTDDVQVNEIHSGKLSRRAGHVAANAIKAAVSLVQQGRADAMVTAPVSKKSLHMAGVIFPGQTEMVQHLSGSKHVAMMLVSATMRVG